MDVVVCPRPGALVIEKRPIPRPAADEVLVRVRRVGLCGTDMHIFRGAQPFLTYPRVMGHELSGEVVSSPQGSPLRPGDAVYVVPYLSCGVCSACRKHRPNCCKSLEVLGVHRDGALAQYLCVPERVVFSARAVTLPEAAMVEFLAIGAHAVRRGEVSSAQQVLVCGTGPIGIACALFSRLRGAEVTVVDIRPERLALCKDKLGVDHALLLDTDTEARLLRISNGDLFDVVFDATGNAEAMQRGFRYIAHGGTYVLVSVVNAEITFSDPEFHKREARLMASRNATVEDFEFVVDCIRSRKIPTADLHTHSAPLAELPARLGAWLDPECKVIKAVVEC